MGKGQLLFKGDKPKKKNKSSKHAVSSSKEKTDSIVVGDHVETMKTGVIPAHRPLSGIPARPSSTTTTTVQPVEPTMKQGTGKITTSGTVVTGYDTRFEKELQPGDAILCIVGGDGGGGTGKNEEQQQQLRVITMRVSNISLNLSSAFSMDIKIPSSFQYIRKPRNIEKERSDLQKQKQQTLQEQKTHAFDLYGNESFVYREKTETGSYRIKRETIVSTTTKSGPPSQRSRGDLLDMRSKKTSDKFC